MHCTQKRRKAQLILLAAFSTIAILTKPDRLMETFSCRPGHDDRRPAELLSAFQVDLHGSPLAIAGPSTHVIAVDLEYRQPVLIGLGEFGVGPSFGYYPAVASRSASGNVSDYSCWELGVRFEYQFRYSENQPFVPYFIYDVQKLRYGGPNSAPSGTIVASGGGAGFAVPLSETIEEWTSSRAASESVILILLLR